MSARSAWKTAWHVARGGGVQAPLQEALLGQALGLLAERETHRYCRNCGCTEYDACPGGCSWISLDLCSECAPWRPQERAEVRRQFRASQGLSPEADPPILPEEDLTGTGWRIFRIDVWGRCIDSLLIERFGDDDDEDDEWDPDEPGPDDDEAWDPDEEDF